MTSVSSPPITAVEGAMRRVAASSRQRSLDVRSRLSIARCSYAFSSDFSGDCLSPTDRAPSSPTKSVSSSRASKPWQETLQEHLLVAGRSLNTPDALVLPPSPSPSFRPLDTTKEQKYVPLVHIGHTELVVALDRVEVRRKLLEEHLSTLRALSETCGDERRRHLSDQPLKVCSDPLRRSLLPPSSQVRPRSPPGSACVSPSVRCREISPSIRCREATIDFDGVDTESVSTSVPASPATQWKCAPSTRSVWSPPKIPHLQLVPLGRSASLGRMTVAQSSPAKSAAQAVSFESSNGLDKAVAEALAPSDLPTLMQACLTKKMAPVEDKSTSGQQVDSTHLEFQVSGAGGVGASTNGLYRQEGVHNGRPFYKLMGGAAIMYFHDFWKINFQLNFQGWLYAAGPNPLDDRHPAVGLWTTFGYASDDAHPPPMLAVQTSKFDLQRGGALEEWPQGEVRDCDDGSHAETEGLGPLPESSAVCTPLTRAWSASSISLNRMDSVDAARSLPRHAVKAKFVKALSRITQDVCALRSRHERQLEQTERLQRTLWPHETLDTQLADVRAKNAELTDWGMLRPSVLGRRSLQPAHSQERVVPQNRAQELIEREAMAQEDLAGTKLRQWHPMPGNRPGEQCEEVCMKLHEREVALRLVLEEEQFLLTDVAAGLPRTTSQVRLRFERDIAQRSGLRATSPSGVPKRQ